MQERSLLLKQIIFSKCCAERVFSAVSLCDLCLGCACFESWPGHVIVLTEVFKDLKLGIDLFHILLVSDSLSLNQPALYMLSF
jgi:hypothetical protein